MSESTFDRTELSADTTLSPRNSNRCDNLFFFTVTDRVDVKVAGANRAADDGLGLLLQYINDHPQSARLRAMDPPDILGGDRNERWDAPLADIARPRSMGGRYMIQVASKEDSDRLESALRQDKRRVSDVNRPFAYRKTLDFEPAMAAAPQARASVQLSAADRKAIDEANATRQWGLDKCGFAEVWAELDRCDKAKPIGMIDIGSRRKHRELQGRIDDYVGTATGVDSLADHASMVAAIMSARRGEVTVDKHDLDAEDMDGCCSAKLQMFNVWSRNDGLDQGALYDAIRTVIDRGLPVLNMSIWIDEEDPELARLLAECEQKRVAVVAAIGNSGDTTKFWPAAYPDVIAVVATDPSDHRHVHSSYGPHATIAAPGEKIFTVSGDDGYVRMSGTSFAAPFVSAAIWLAKCKRPELTNDQVRQLLAKSVVPTNSEELACGRLDMRKLLEVLPTI